MPIVPGQCEAGYDYLPNYAFIARLHDSVIYKKLPILKLEKDDLIPLRPVVHWIQPK